jgi:hypothetical protein
MRQFIDIITEAFNSPVDYHWVSHGPVTWQANFRIKPMNYYVYIEKVGGDPEWTISFSAFDETSSNMFATQEATGTGNSWAVYSTVLAVIDDFMDQYDDVVQRLVIESDTTERNRHNVNTRIAKIIADRWNFTIQNDPEEGTLTLSRDPQGDDDEDNEEIYA